MAAEGIQFPWQWYGSTISTDLDVIWGMSDHRGKPGPPKRQYSEVWPAGSFTGGCERRDIKGESAATVFPSRRRDVMGGPEWLLELREKTARMPIVLPLSAIGRSHLGNPG